MKKLYLASMIWSEGEEPIATGFNKRKLVKESLRILKEEHGERPVNRGSAFCSIKIQSSDIKLTEIPVVE